MQITVFQSPTLLTTSTLVENRVACAFGESGFWPFTQQSHEFASVNFSNM